MIDIDLKYYKKEDLECCGNCAYRVNLDKITYSEESCREFQNTAIGSHKKCEKWKYDEIGEKERMVNLVRRAI